MMNNRIKISEVKEIAKEQLLGNYKVAVLSFAIICIGAFSLMMLVSTSIFGVAIGSTGLPTMEIAGSNPTILYSIILYAAMAITEAIIATFAVGLKKINLKIARGERAEVKDITFAVKNHPDKVIIMFFIMFIIELVLGLGFSYAQTYLDVFELSEAIKTVISIATELITRLITFIILISFSQMYFVYLDNPQQSVKYFISESFRLMKGNKLRLLGFYFSMLGWWLLGILSLGVGFLWIIPYQNVALACFYRGIKGEIGSRFERTV